MSSNAKVFSLKTVREIEKSDELLKLLPMIESYAMSVHGSKDVMEHLIIDMMSCVRGQGATVLVLFDNREQNDVGYIVLRAIQNLMEKQCYIIHIYSEPGYGSELYAESIDWARNAGCSSVIGFVPVDQIEECSRLWGAEPWKTVLRREI